MYCGHVSIHKIHWNPISSNERALSYYKILHFYSQQKDIKFIGNIAKNMCYAFLQPFELSFHPPERFLFQSEVN